MKQKFEVSETSPKNIEDVLDHIGGFGKFQILVISILELLDLPAAILALLPVFIGTNTAQWMCEENEITTKNICRCNGTLSPSLPYTSIVPEWDLICGKAWIVDSITSVQMVGSVVASLFSAPIADLYGRRFAMNGICAIFAVGAVMTALAPNLYIFTTGRFLIGAGSSGSQGLATVYAIEFMPIRWRPLPTSIRPYGEGMMLLGLLAYLFRPWRTLAWVAAAFILVVICILPIVPESPRWLLQQGEISKALQVLRRIAKMNNRPPLEEAVVREIVAREIKPTTEKTSYMTIFRDRHLRKIALCLMATWFSFGMVFFGLAFNIKNTPGNPYLTMVYLGIADTFGAPTSFLLINRLGRKASVVLSMLLGTTFLVTLSVVYTSLDVSVYSDLIMILYVLAKYSLAIARATLRCHGAELFPTSVRSMGIGMCGVALSLGATVCPLFAYLGSRNPAIPFLAFAAISVAGSLLTLVLPETNGKPLEDSVLKNAEKP